VKSQKTELLVELSLTIFTTYGKEPFLIGVSATSDAVTEEKEKIGINTKHCIDFFLF
jgi:hypothetical protein